MCYPVSDEALEALVCLFKRFVFLGSRTGKSISLKKASHVLLFYTMENK